MNKVTLQVPMSKALKTSAEKVANEYGFSSLQEIVRVLLSKLAKRELTVTVKEQVEEVTYLSPAAELRYKKAIEDIRAGRNVTKTESVDELLRLLRS